MHKAIVIGGHPGLGVAWRKRLRDQAGIELTEWYRSTDNYRGLPRELPAGIDVVLMLKDQCSHAAWHSGKDLAQRAGVPWVSVMSKGTAAVESLRALGFGRLPELISEAVALPAAEVAPAVAPTVAPPVPPACLEVDLDAGTVESVSPDPELLTSREIQEMVGYSLPGQHPYTPVYWASAQLERKGLVVTRTARRAEKIVRSNGTEFIRAREARVWTLDEVAMLEPLIRQWLANHDNTDQPVSEPGATQVPVLAPQSFDGLVAALAPDQEGQRLPVAAALEGVRSAVATYLAALHKQYWAEGASIAELQAQLEAERKAHAALRQRLAALVSE